mmetsp:Transcript_125406/g.316032  ORF Transcript_125406/g.316032 Transcript_125406/m.316032 type:complete len:214 (+) Transcript_125406:1443-2084(+)
MLQGVKSRLDASLPPLVALLRALRDLVSILGVDGSQDHLRKDADREQEERHPKEQVQPVVLIGGDHDIRQDCGGHGDKHGVHSVAIILETLVYGRAVGILLGHVVEEHRRDPGEDDDRADQEDADGHDLPGDPHEGEDHVVDPRDRDGEAEADEGRDADRGLGEEGEVEGVAESEQDHDVVHDHRDVGPVGQADAFEELVQPGGVEHPRHDDA